jgi:ABC-type transporter Mla MlaB component
MLRVTVHEDGTQCRLELAGKLGGPWVAETEHVWRSWSCADKEIEVDMRQVTGVDEAGRKLLLAMHQAGARLVAEGVAMTALVEEITGNQSFNDAKQPRRRKFARRSKSRYQESSQ